MLDLKNQCLHPATSKPYIISSKGGRENSIEGLQVCLVLEALYSRSAYFRRSRTAWRISSYTNSTIPKTETIMSDRIRHISYSYKVRRVLLIRRKLWTLRLAYGEVLVYRTCGVDLRVVTWWMLSWSLICYISYFEFDPYLIRNIFRSCESLEDVTPPALAIPIRQRQQQHSWKTSPFRQYHHIG